ncbi:MAG: class B sortase [Eubacterium sp.]|nr:class B sortase [Eubacterium sp.]
MAAQYTIKAPRKNGVAVKKPGLFVRFLKFLFPWKGDGVIDVIRKLIFLIALAVFIITAVPLLMDVYSMYKDQWDNERLIQIYNPEGSTGGEKTGEILPSFKELLAINPETVGYIRIKGTNIDYPVVQHEDNDYYLDHDFYGEPNRSGCIMLDYKCKVAPEGNSANLVLYGHHMAVGTYFANLKWYWDSIYNDYDNPMSYYKEHPLITFNTIYEEAQWKIFAIDLFNTEERYGEVYNYNNKHDFTSREDFNNFIIDIMDRSDVFTDVDIQYGDEILTLSTCVWPWRGDMENVRLGIFARKVRPGESTDVNVDAVVRNPGVYRWQWVYDNVNGGNWSYSSWDRRKLLSYTEEDALKDGYTFIS